MTSRYKASKPDVNYCPNCGTKMYGGKNNV